MRRVSSAACSFLIAGLLRGGIEHPAYTLDDFEKMAMELNPTIVEANAAVLEDAGRAKQEGLWPNPSVGYQGEQIRGGTYGGGEQGGFVEQTFVLGGKLRLRREVLEQQRRSDEIGVTQQRLRVRSDVGRSFYAALAAQKTVGLRKQLLEVAKDSVETARQMQNVGQADAPDVLQAEVEAEQAEVDVETAERNYIGEFRGLAALVGRDNLPLSPVSGAFEEYPRIDVDQSVGRIMRQSPEVQRAEQQVLRAEAELKSAKREGVPDVSIHAGLQHNYEHLNDTTGRAVGLQGFATAGVTLPVFNHNQGGIQSAEAGVEKARAEAMRVRLAVRRNAETLAELYSVNRAQAEQYRQEMVPRAQKAYELYSSRYQDMASPYSNVIMSQRTLFQLRASYINVLRELWTQAVMLENYVLEGGLNVRMMVAAP